MKVISRIGWLGLAWGMAALGCAPAENNSSLVPVQGVVRVGGNLATTGAVSFHPINDETGVLPVGTIQSDGSYQVYVHGQPGAPEGTYYVTIFMHEKVSRRSGHVGLPESLIDQRYNAKQTTPLSVDVCRDAGPGHYDLNIVTTSRSQ